MPTLTHPTQTSFVESHNIVDNIIVNHEIIHIMRIKEWKNGWMGVKLDLEKGYNRLNWAFVEDTLIDVGMSHQRR